MRTIQEKLDSLNEESVWIFTKQSTIFDEAFRAAQLFNDACTQLVNLEDYFSSHYAEYGISTDRHRIWIISQMFGLITKTPFFTRGTHYAKERPTAVFDLLNRCEIGDEKYNLLKSEQLLKVRVKPIIDSTPDRYDQVILPLLFSYQVLKKLQTDYNIQSITLDQFFTYVMTCKRFSEVEESAFLLSKNPEITDFIRSYKGRSRIVPLFSANSNLLNINNSSVSINPKFDNYFYKNLVSQISVPELELILEDPNAYAYFLYNCQNFNVNLIDESVVDETQNTDINLTTIKNILETLDENETYDSGYVELVDEVKGENINSDIAKDAYKNKLQYFEGKKGIKVVKNPLFGKIVIQQSDYLCDANPAHITFESKTTGKNFMEAHHLTPMSFAKEIFDKFNVNTDCVENIVSLCPNCHRAAHYGSNRVKKDLLTNLFDKKIADYKKIGIDITLEDLLKMYK